MNQITLSSPDGLGLERQRPSPGLDDNKMMIGIGIYEHMPTLKSRDKSCEAGEWLKATTPTCYVTWWVM